MWVRRLQAAERRPAGADQVDTCSSRTFHCQLLPSFQARWPPQSLPNLSSDSKTSPFLVLTWSNISNWMDLPFLLANAERSRRNFLHQKPDQLPGNVSRVMKKEAPYSCHQTSQWGRGALPHFANQSSPFYVPYKDGSRRKRKYNVNGFQTP